MSHSLCQAKHSWVLDNPVRALFTDRKKDLRKLQVTPQMKVLEIGCGTGFYTVVLAKLINPSEIVAVDIQSEMIEKLQKKLKRNHLSNVTTIVADAGDLKLPENRFNLVLLTYSFHEIERKRQALERFYELLLPKGKLSLVDPRFEVSSQEKVEYKKLIISCGFKSVLDKSSFASHWMVFEKTI